jgi:hypothetical protein
VLRRQEPRDALLEAVAGSDRLVLLGDVIELRHGPLREALAASQPALEAIGAAMRPDAEVVIVPGNHDHRLLRPWLGRRAANGPAAAFGLEAGVDWREGEPLERLAAWLGPARTRAAYPGVWLREDVYAMHGHYADRNTTLPILERLGAGVMGRVLAGRNGRPASAEDYEATLAPMYAWIDSVAEQGGLSAGGGGSVQVRAWRGLQASSRGRVRPGARVRAGAVALGFRTLVFALNRAGIGPLRADVSGPELRRSGLHAFGRVLVDLGISAGHVMFGHTHRAGPLPGDDGSEWVTPAGTRLLNTGCWVYERGFLGGEPRRSPYRPGFAAVLEDAGAPELVNLLDPA